MAVTIRDVARLAGVSPSTVSRVLNQKGVISNDTKQRILNAMEELQYVPNDFARSFAIGSPQAIALVIDIADPGAYSNHFFNNTVFGIETTAHKNDYNLMITNASQPFGGVSAVERLMMGKKIDGIVLPISIVTDELLQKVEMLQFPCVILGHPEEVKTETNWIDINNAQAAGKAVKHLLQRGYRDIAFLSDGDAEVFNRDRISGYCRELAANGLPVLPSRMMHGAPSLESGMQCMQALLDSEAPPDAVVCSDDRLALGAIRASRAAGLRIPEDLGVVSFDNTPVTELAEPSITSIHIDTFELGVQAAEMLINQIEKPDSSIRQILLSTKIMERASTQRL